jgi:sulfatase modifying factor 1
MLLIPKSKRVLKAHGNIQCPLLRSARWLVAVTALAGFYGFLAALVGVLPGCVKQKCYDDLDCPAPKICSDSGECVYECLSDSDCGAGFICADHLCRPNPQGPIVCPPGMVAVADTFCIDRFEASRIDATDTDAGVDNSRAQSVSYVMPWQVTSNADADAACLAAGKRLCTPEEWQLACEGSDHTVYSYGDSYDPYACNGIDTFGPDWCCFKLIPTGSLASCTNEWDVLDMNGNLWEHVAGGDDMTVRGGAFNCSDSAFLHRCEYIPATWSPSAKGFRCCLSPPASASSPSAEMIRPSGRRHLRPAGSHPLEPALP